VAHSGRIGDGPHAIHLPVRARPTTDEQDDDGRSINGVAPVTYAPDASPRLP